MATTRSRQPSAIDLSSDSDSSSKDVIPLQTRGLRQVSVKLQRVADRVSKANDNQSGSISGKNPARRVELRAPVTPEKSLQSSVSSRLRSVSKLTRSPECRMKRPRTSSSDASPVKVVNGQERTPMKNKSDEPSIVVMSSDDDDDGYQNLHQTSIHNFFKSDDGESKSNCRKSENVDSGSSVKNGSSSRKRSHLNVKDSGNSSRMSVNSAAQQYEGVRDQAAQNTSDNLVSSVRGTLNDICSLLSPGFDETEMKILTKLRKRFEDTIVACKSIAPCERSVHKSLGKCLSGLKQEPERCFTLLRILIEELDQIRLTARFQVIVSDESANVSTSDTSKPSTSKQLTAESDHKKHRLKQKQIAKLEKTLRQLEREIVRYDAEEVDWSDDGGSSYIIAAKLKRRYVKVYKVYCRSVGEFEQAAHVNRRRLIRFDATRYPEINRCLEKFVNRSGEFPDYGDVLEQVRDANDRYSLHLSEHALEEISNQAFHVLGAHLQRCRRLELVESMDSLSNGVDWRKLDPAHEDTQLDQVLVKNAIEGEERINQVLKRYTHLQNERKEQEESEEGASSESEVTDDFSESDTEEAHVSSRVQSEKEKSAIDDQSECSGKIESDSVVESSISCQDEKLSLSEAGCAASADCDPTPALMAFDSELTEFTDSPELFAETVGQSSCEQQDEAAQKTTDTASQSDSNMNDSVEVISLNVTPPVTASSVFD